MQVCIPDHLCQPEFLALHTTASMKILRSCYLYSKDCACLQKSAQAQAIKFEMLYCGEFKSNDKAVKMKQSFVMINCTSISQ